MNDVKLSASRIKTAQGCSWKYWANYVLKLPQKGNDGSNRGTICHDIFETLGSHEYLDEYKNILDSGTVMGSEKISKTLLDHAKELGVDDEENIELMDMMIMRGLLFDFFHFLFVRFPFVFVFKVLKAFTTEKFLEHLFFRNKKYLYSFKNYLDFVGFF